MKGGDILDFKKGGNLRKGGYDPPYQLCRVSHLNNKINYKIMNKILKQNNLMNKRLSEIGK